MIMKRIYRDFIKERRDKEIQYRYARQIRFCVMKARNYRSTRRISQEERKLQTRDIKHMKGTPWM